ncbi:hypothetical protein DRQ33_01300 [bacterium]|mgnify:CR=1 FL=1|nr:MAG: hypothetical protein DRQ33_01300 [bacterium]
MKKYSFCIIIFWVIIWFAGLLFAQLPFPVEQYRKLIEEQTGEIPPSEKVKRYKSPQYYETMDTTILPTREVREVYMYPGELESLYVDTLPYFDEPVIMNGETIQVIRKATPRYLKRFGADFFENIPDVQTAQLPVSGKYVLGSGDQLVLNVWGGLNAQYELTVDREGSVYIPQVGNIAVGGLTLDSAESTIKKALSANFSDFSANLTLSQVKSVRVFVVGQVKYPGVYDLPGISRLMNALVVAGGPNSVGSYRNIIVYRGMGKITTFDIYEFINGEQASGNLQLATGDIVIVPHYDILVKLRGMVKTPAKYELLPDEDIGDLLRFAGGITPQGNRNAIFVDRIISGVHRSLTINITDSTQAHTKLSDGDDISVFPVNPYREQIVFLEGYVSQPGAYGWFEGMKVSDLFEGENSIFENTYMQRVDILRKTSEGKRKLLFTNLSRALSGDSTYNISLMPHDKVIVYSLMDFMEDETVNIYGAVRDPGVYPLYENMRLLDLIFEAKGVRDNAYLDSAEIVRIEDGKSIRKINIPLNKIFSNPDSPENILLKKDDFLFIRKIPDWQTLRQVTILGEVNFPGTYALVSDDEKLSNIIKRAGGVTNDAFLDGAIFIRPIISEQMERKNILKVIRNTQQLFKDTLGQIDTTSLLFFWDPAELREIIIDMNKIVQGETDIVMEDGDTVFIPKVPDGVSVVGAVGANGTVKYIHGAKLKYYISKAGGITKNGDKSEMRLVKPSGRVVKVDMGYKEVGPGDVIVVPQKIRKESDVLGTLRDIAMVLSSVATTLYIILKL